jgi:hypothetical protein
MRRVSSTRPSQSGTRPARRSSRQPLAGPPTIGWKPCICTPAREAAVARWLYDGRSSVVPVAAPSALTAQIKRPPGSTYQTLSKTVIATTNSEITSAQLGIQKGQVAREHTPLVPVAHAATACGALAAAGYRSPDYDPFGRCAAGLGPPVANLATCRECVLIANNRTLIQHAHDRW